MRHKVAIDFGIEKKGSTHVVDNRIESDGYLIEEVEAIFTIEKLQAYLQTKEKDPQNLILMLVKSIDDPGYLEGKAVVSEPTPAMTHVEDTPSDLNTDMIDEQLKVEEEKQTQSKSQQRRIAEMKNAETKESK